jgi:hypothetical protein
MKLVPSMRTTAKALKTSGFKHSLALGAVVLLGACTSDRFQEPMKLGGRWISSSTLNLGHDTYMNYCMQCHGVNGDGLGPAAQGTYPPPRNFKQGAFKFASVGAGELPTDEDLKYTIRNGLRGTPMLPWDISDERLDAVVQYMKTFSDVWKDGEPGTPLQLTPDPWGAERSEEAIALGKKIYHGIAQCYTCHPAYAPLSEINEASLETTGNAVASIRENAHLSTLLDSSYGHKFMPPDFTKNFIKTGGDPESIYKVLGPGINGTAMPAWKGLLSATGSFEDSEKNQWALAYYVSYLNTFRFDDKARKAFFESLAR